jgi:hypothetical protein
MPRKPVGRDNGDGTCRNPVLYADYSDPDVIRVGTDFYVSGVGNWRCGRKAFTALMSAKLYWLEAAQPRIDGTNLTDVGTPFTAKQGRWIGAKVGL